MRRQSHDIRFVHMCLCLEVLLAAGCGICRHWAEIGGGQARHLWAFVKVVDDRQSWWPRQWRRAGSVARHWDAA